MSWQRTQRALISEALESASRDRLIDTLDGTLGDALAFCWGALTQYERRDHPFAARTPREHGQHHVEMHTLLLLAHEAVCHVEQVERVLGQIGQRRTFAPDAFMRKRLAEARNLLAEHRDERVLYWRLTGQHTQHVVDVYAQLGVDLPPGGIDSERFDDVPTATAFHWGTVGGLVSLADLRRAFQELEAQLLAVVAEVRTWTGTR